MVRVVDKKLLVYHWSDAGLVMVLSCLCWLMSSPKFLILKGALEICQSP